MEYCTTYIYIDTIYKKGGFTMVIGRGRRREHPKPTFCTTTKKKAREKAGHAQNILPCRTCSGHVISGSHVTDVTSCEKTPLGRTLRNFRLRMRRTYFRTGPQSRDFRHMTDVTFGHVTSGHDPPHGPPQIITELYPYTTYSLMLRA